jgi:hypothetical protein
LKISELKRRLKAEQKEKEKQEKVATQPKVADKPAAAAAAVDEENIDPNVTIYMTS